MTAKAAIERYHRWVSTRACSCCGIEMYTQVAHYQGIRGFVFGRGLSKKANDLMVAPLCCDRPGKKGCHSRFDSNEISSTDTVEINTGKIDRSELFLFWIIQTIMAAEKQGVIKVE